MGFIQNWFHLFNLIGPYLFFFVVLCGVALLIPPQQKTFKVIKKSLQVQLTRMLCIPFGWTISKIAWLCLVDSNDDFFSVPAWTFLAGGLAVGYIFYRSIEYFTWRKYHGWDGLIATLENVNNAYLPENIREQIQPLLQDLKQFNLKY